MRRFMVVFSLAFFGMLCLSGSIMAQAPPSLEFAMYEYTTPWDPNVRYGAGYEAWGDRITLVGIRVPTGKILRTDTPVQHYYSEVENFVDAGLYAEFSQRFPKGEYGAGIRLGGGPLLTATFHMTHNFPDMPVLINPTNGQTGVTLNPLIEWEPLSGIDSLELEIEGEDIDLAVGLPPEATSYQLPSGILQPNTEYFLSLCASISSLENRVEKINRSDRWISFTTGPE